MTRPLSPAAQAVLDAAIEAAFSPDAEAVAAAVLRAAADRVVPGGDCPDAEEWAGQSAWVQAESGVRFRLLAIAAELEAPSSLG